ncbi:MAG: SprT-like domain-containing protein [Pseudomonadota bacterium]
MTVQALDHNREDLVTNEVARYLGLVEREFSVEMPGIPVHFDLIGNTLGMYCKKKGVRSIRFNSYAFSKYWNENFANTIPHEVAHYVSDSLFDHRYLKPHGREWQSIMRFFGADPAVRCYFDLSDIPKRKMQHFSYACACGQHELSAIRHNRINSGRRRYYCRRCQEELVAAD